MSQNSSELSINSNSLINFASKYSAYLQAAPLTLILIIFAAIPVGIILMYSVFVFNGFVTVLGFTFASYIEIFTDWTSLLNLWHTIRIFGITWIITLVLGFIISYFLVFDLISFKVKVFFFLLTVVPFWTSGVVRMIAWIPFLGTKGVLNSTLLSVGLIDEPLQFLLFSWVYFFSTFIPGSSFPSIDSRKAPPAVDKCVKTFLNSTFFIAAIVSPPPTIEIRDFD